MPLLQGARRQPKGFTRYQVIATALDPRTMTLYRVREEEHSDVWDVVVEDLVNRMAEEDAAAGEKVACRWRLSSEFEVLREMVPDTGPVERLPTRNSVYGLQWRRLIGILVEWGGHCLHELRFCQKISQQRYSAISHGCSTAM